MTTTEYKAEILRNFPAGADAYQVWRAVEQVIERTPKVPGKAALCVLILDLGPIYAKYAHRRITLRPNCAFVNLVAATALACGWTASRESICDMEMRMRQPAARRAFGKRAA